MAPSAPPALRPGALIDDQYRLQREIGSGGVGTVWEADHLRIGGSVAIKFLDERHLQNEEVKMRFVREARSASRLRSPHVVQVLDQGTTPLGVPYLVMELLEGEDLRARLDRAGPCRLVEAAVILDQIARALRKAHREGMVHRDIKPHNIFLIPEGDRPFVKLLDFGIAKDGEFDAKSVTLTGALMGSAHYMSPEQVDDPKSVAAATDIWALGVVVYEMLTGVVPFDGDSVPGVLTRVQQGTFEPASHGRLDLPAALDDWFKRAIHVDPACRFESVEEMSRTFCEIARAHSSRYFEQVPTEITENPLAWSTPPVLAPRTAAASLITAITLAPWYRKTTWGLAATLVAAWAWLAIVHTKKMRTRDLARIQHVQPAKPAPSTLIELEPHADASSRPLPPDSERSAALTDIDNRPVEPAIEAGKEAPAPPKRRVPRTAAAARAPAQEPAPEATRRDARGNVAHPKDRGF